MGYASLKLFDKGDAAFIFMLMFMPVVPGSKLYRLGMKDTLVNSETVCLSFVDYSCDRAIKTLCSL